VGKLLNSKEGLALLDCAEALMQSGLGNLLVT